jgi:hypothetical protein
VLAQQQQQKQTATKSVLKALSFGQLLLKKSFTEPKKVNK